MKTFKSIFSLKDEKRWIKMTIFTMLAVFCGICICTSLYYGNRLLLGSFETFDNDDGRYIRSAITLIDTGKFTCKYPDQSTVFMMPGMVFLLVPFVKMFGMWGAITAFRIFQAIMQTVTMYIFFLIARRIFGSKFAIISTGLTMLYLPVIYTTTLILSEIPFLFLFSLLTLLIIHAVETKRTGIYIAGGFCWGACALFRPIIAAFPVVILILWIIKKYKIRDIVKFTLIAATCFVIVLSPWWIRNYVTFHKFIPFTIATGNPALQGAFINYEQDYTDIDTSGVEYGNTELSIDEAEKTISERVIVYNFRKNPVRYIIWMIFGKTVMNFRFPFIWYDLYGIAFVNVVIMHLIILFSGIAGAVMGIFRRNLAGYGWLLLGSVLYFNCIHLPFYCFARYVYPAMPLIIMGAVYFIREMVCILKVRKSH